MCLETWETTKSLEYGDSAFLNIESVWKQENDKILWVTEKRDPLTRGTEWQFRCLDKDIIKQTMGNIRPVKKDELTFCH